MGSRNPNPNPVIQDIEDIQHRSDPELLSTQAMFQSEIPISENSKTLEPLPREISQISGPKLHTDALEN